MRMLRAQPRQRLDSHVVAQAVGAGVLCESFYQVTRQQHPNLILPSSGEIAEQIVIEPAHERAQRKEVGSRRFSVVLRYFGLFHAGILTDNRVFRMSGGVVWTEPRRA